MKVWIWLKVAKSTAEAVYTTRAQCSLRSVFNHKSTANWSEMDFSYWNLARTRRKNPAIASLSDNYLRVDSTIAGSFYVITQSSWSVSSDWRAWRSTFVNEAPGVAKLAFFFLPRETLVILDSMLSRWTSLGKSLRFWAVTFIIGTSSWSKLATW